MKIIISSTIKNSELVLYQDNERFAVILRNEAKSIERRKNYSNYEIASQEFHEAIRKVREYETTNNSQ